MTSRSYTVPHGLGLTDMYIIIPIAIMMYNYIVVQTLSIRYSRRLADTILLDIVEAVS